MLRTWGIALGLALLAFGSENRVHGQVLVPNNAPIVGVNTGGPVIGGQGYTIVGSGTAPVVGQNGFGRPVNIPEFRPTNVVGSPMQRQSTSTSNFLNFNIFDFFTGLLDTGPAIVVTPTGTPRSPSRGTVIPGPQGIR